MSVLRFSMVAAFLLALGFGGAIAACASDETADGRTQPEDNTITVREGTRAPYGDLMIGVSNVWEDDYTGTDGKKHRGLTAVLTITDRRDRAKSRMVTAGGGGGGGDKSKLKTTSPALL